MARGLLVTAAGILLMATLGAADARVAEDRYVSGFVNPCGLGSYDSLHALGGFGDDVADAALVFLAGQDNGVEPGVPGAVPDVPLLPDGACFALHPGERTASVQLFGDAEQPRAFWYGFTQATTLIGSDVVCGDAADLAVPAGAEMLSVVVYTVDRCGADGTAATTGTVTVAFG